MAERTAVLQKVSQLRSVRRQVIEDAQSFSLQHVVQRLQLAEHEDQASSVYVVKVLDTHPCLGKVAGRKLMATLSIEPFVSIGQLTTTQLDALIKSCRCTNG
jgi:hypothetical protein